METLTLSEAKAGFDDVMLRVIKSRKPVLVRTPAGYVQIAPYEASKVPSATSRRSLGKFTAEQYRLHNTIGDSL